ncbi:hypothetical protein PVK06_035399 [Gossypium arboreum]|uniref:RNase H type-1 domain-containing protein n=1 Tax=Gossypium arboreum TaxID=29729 RepID=A0ABR0NGQ5_GOSAR|nr:hypothetical protein PVK06_035399 [Gossypium arboreum]
MRLGLAMGVEKIEIEGDTSTIIKKCLSTTIEKLKIGAYIIDIQYKKSGFQSIQFKYIQRLTNKIAHKIASESLKRREEVYLEGFIAQICFGVAGI